MTWTPERVETLKKMFAEGMSASRIAEAIGWTTRNAVIGKVHRLGLSGRATTIRMNRARDSQAKRLRAARRERDASRREIIRSEKAGQKAIVAELFRRVELPSEPVQFAEDVVPLVRNLLDLEDHHCRWIPGEVPDGFCGRNKVGGLVYCEFHAKRAYMPPKSPDRARTPKHVIDFARVDSIKLSDVAEFVGA